MRQCLLITTLLALLTSSLNAQENLLWKTRNAVSPTAVPMYSDQPNPFPAAPEPAEADPNAEAAALLEQERMKEIALNNARTAVSSGQGLEPLINSLRVGGMLEGIRGARVLINNEWVGKGSQVKVRQVKSANVEQTIKALADLDESAATELTGQLNQQLSQNSFTTLTVQAITSQSVVLMVSQVKRTE